MAGGKLGEIYIELVLNDGKFKKGVDDNKSYAEKAGRDIEKTSSASGDRQLESYNKFLKEKESSLQKSLYSQIQSQDKAAAAIMQNNQTQVANEVKLRESILSSQTSLNQQRLKETLSYDREVTKAVSGQMGAWQKLYAVQSNAPKPDLSYFGKMIETSKHVIQAAPGYAIATAAIASVYVALRAVTGEFVRGLSAVEDYSLKVASMGAFLTTFSTSLTKTNASEIYRASTAEAETLVQTMEKLDARTIATGKDLTTMAEQFIKGGVRIDTTNKGTLDGFVNIANALKLMTQGQNQEIQMRQEIRALVQGQMKDTNVLAKTLQSIDPNIKEHIKLWRQQGTLIENVGGLLAGFGPAAKDLEKTWAVVGSTMETIHTRILRGMFKPTYDSLLETAREWNKTFMDADGNLTPLAIKISEMGKTALNFLGNIVSWGVELLKISAIALPLFAIFSKGPAILALLRVAVIDVNKAMLLFNLTTMTNPIFLAVAGAAAVYGIMKIKDSINEANKETIVSIQKTDEWNNKLNEIGQNSSSVGEVMSKTKLLNDELERKVKDDSLINLLYKVTGIKIDTSDIEKMRDIANGKIDEDSWLSKIDRFLKATGGDGGTSNRVKKEMEAAKDAANKASGFSIFDDKRSEFATGGRQPAKLTATGYQQDVNIGQARKMIDLSAADLSGLKSTITTPADEMKRKNLMHGMNEEKKAIFEITNSLGKYKEAYDDMVAAGNAREANEAKNYLISIARRADSLKASDKAVKEEKKNDQAFIDLKKQILAEGEKLSKQKEKLLTKETKFIKTELDNRLKENSDYYNTENQLLEAQNNANLLLESEYLKRKRELQQQELKGQASLIGDAIGDYESKLQSILDAGVGMEEGGLFDKTFEEANTLSVQLDELMKKMALLKKIAVIEDKKDGDWVSGATKSLEKYGKDATNISKQVGDVFEQSFKGMEDALFNFVKTGKINFDDLANSIIDSMIRIAIQQTITGPLATVASQGMTTAATAIGSGISNFFASANGNAFNGISGLSNSIVSSPTMFSHRGLTPFANGGGILGEAGPEAVMPLRRNSSGKLGVVASGGGTETMKVEINVVNKSSQPVTASSGGGRFDGKSYIITTVLEDVQTNGPLRGLFAGGSING